MTWRIWTNSTRTRARRTSQGRTVCSLAPLFAVGCATGTAADRQADNGVRSGDGDEVGRRVTAIADAYLSAYRVTFPEHATETAGRTRDMTGCMIDRRRPNRRGTYRRTAGLTSSVHSMAPSRSVILPGSRTACSASGRCRADSTRRLGRTANCRACSRVNLSGAIRARGAQREGQAQDFTSHAAPAIRRPRSRC